MTALPQLSAAHHAQQAPRLRLQPAPQHVCQCGRNVDVVFRNGTTIKVDSVWNTMNQLEQYEHICPPRVLARPSSSVSTDHPTSIPDPSPLTNQAINSVKDTHLVKTILNVLFPITLISTPLALNDWENTEFINWQLVRQASATIMIISILAIIILSKDKK